MQLEQAIYYMYFPAGARFRHDEAPDLELSVNSKVEPSFDLLPLGTGCVREAAAPCATRADADAVMSTISMRI